MLPADFYHLPEYTSIVTITTLGMQGEHIKTLWNIYLFITEDDRLLIPFEDYSNTENDIKFNTHVKIAIRNSEVENRNNKNYPGIGFLLSGEAKFVDFGTEFDMIKTKYPRAYSAMEVTIHKCKQML